MTSKLKSKPPAASAEDFISGAERREALNSSSVPEQKGRAAESYPWTDPMVRDDVTKVYNLRLPEPYLLKLKYIAAHTPDSMQQFCLDNLLPAIDQKIKELM